MPDSTDDHPVDEVPDFCETSISKVGALLSDFTRAAMLMALVKSEQPLPASELAECAQITASTTSIHLAKLLEAGWISVEQSGRCRYYRLASPRIANVLREIASIAPGQNGQLIQQDHSPRHSDLRPARTCYDHLAGRLGVEITEALIRQGVLQTREKDFQLTNEGIEILQGRGLDLVPVLKQRRAFALRCQDWTERRDHLGGALGAAICRLWLDHHWVEHQEGSRALRLTSAGIAQLLEWDISWLPDEQILTRAIG